MDGYIETAKECPKCHKKTLFFYSIVIEISERKFQGKLGVKCHSCGYKEVLKEVKNRCHVCGKKADVVCDWCNILFCNEHWKEHNTDECKRIGLEQAKQVK